MLWTLCPKSPGLTKCRGGHEINEDSGWDSNFMQFHAISNFGFAFGLQTVFMLSFFVPWHALFASTHFVAFTCQMDFVAKAPCVLAWLVQGAKAGALLDRVPFFKILFFPLLFSLPKSIGKEVAFKTQVTNFNPESATQASGKDAPLELDNETCLKHTRFWLHIVDCLNTYLRIWSFSEFQIN